MLFITHQLSTIAGVDEIVVLHEGKIVERGCHQSLLNANGKYAAMWAVQSDIQKNLSF